MTPVNSTHGLRHPRAFFEKRLRKILESISKGEWVNLHWNESILPGGPFTGRAKATALWVVGSFARGSEYCGDLDLVLLADIERHSFRAPNKTVCNALVGVHQYVRVYLGTPKENNSHASFENAVLLWSKDQPNWGRALFAIQVNPDAGRHEREWDNIPLRMEQARISDPDELLGQKKAGIIDWQWIEWDELSSAAGVEANIPKRRLERIKLHRSSKYGQCLELAAKWLSHKEPPDSWEPHIRNDLPLIVGGYALIISPMPSIELSYLDSTTCHTLLIMPYKTKRGPNGMWVVTRGQNHPAGQKENLNHA